VDQVVALHDLTLTANRSKDRWRIEVAIDEHLKPLESAVAVMSANGSGEKKQ